MFFLLLVVGSARAVAQDPYLAVHLNLRDENGNPVPSKDTDTFVVSFQMMDFCDNKSGKICRITEFHGSGLVNAGDQKFHASGNYNWGIFRMEVRHGNEKMEVRFHPDIAKMREHWHLKKESMWNLDLNLDMQWSPGYYEVTQMETTPGHITFDQQQGRPMQLVPDKERMLDPVLSFKVKWVK